MSQKQNTSKKELAKKGKNGCKNVAEVGIPTIFTPVPSDESCLIEEQTRLRLLREPVPPSDKTSDLSSFRESLTNAECLVEPDNKNESSNENRYVVVNSRDLTRMVFIRVHFMQNFYTSFEMATDKTLLVLLRYVLKMISKEIRNKFSFYVFASPYDVIWKRPRCELMKKPPPKSVFRYIITPSQMDMTLGQFFREENIEGLDTMNVYIFIKDMEDTSTCNEKQLSRKSWKFQQVIEK